MLPYFLLFGVPIVYYGVASMTNNYNRQKRNQTAIILFFVGWFLLLSLRHFTVGCDIQGYLVRFQQVVKTPWGKLRDLSEKEIGYQILCKLISYITTDNQVFLMLIAVLTLCPIGYLYARESNNALLVISIFVTYLFSMYFSGLRQILAMGFAVPAYYLTKSKKPFWFILVVLLASSIHQSAIIMLLVYPIYHFKMTPVKLFFVVGLIAFVFIFSRQIFSFLLNIIGGDYEERYNELTETGAYSILLLFAIFAVYAFMVPRKGGVDKDTMGLRNILLLSVVLQCFALVNPIAMRMNYYFIIFTPILISKIATLYREKDKGLITFSVYLMTGFFLFSFFYKAYTGVDILNVFPYIPFWLN